jgi:hypothetical protein
MLCAALGGPLLPAPAAADRGAITFIPHALLNEPRQQAVLAWNEQEQVTVLSTDLRSSEPTPILQVMPFPSEPLVEEADIQIFKELNRLAVKGLRGHSYGRSRSRSSEPGRPGRSPSTSASARTRSSPSAPTGRRGSPRG